MAKTRTKSGWGSVWKAQAIRWLENFGPLDTDEVLALAEVASGGQVEGFPYSRRKLGAGVAVGFELRRVGGGAPLAVRSRRCRERLIDLIEERYCQQDERLDEFADRIRREAGFRRRSL